MALTFYRLEALLDQTSIYSISVCPGLRIRAHAIATRFSSNSKSTNQEGLLQGWPAVATFADLGASVCPDLGENTPDNFKLAVSYHRLGQYLGNDLSELDQASCINHYIEVINYFLGKTWASEDLYFDRGLFDDRFSLAPSDQSVGLLRMVSSDQIESHDIPLELKSLEPDEQYKGYLSPFVGLGSRIWNVIKVQ